MSEYNFTINAGDSLVLPMQYKVKETDTPIDITGGGMLMDFADNALDRSCQITDAVNGRFNVVFVPLDTINKIGTSKTRCYPYSMRYTDITTAVTTLFTGTMTIERGV